MAPEAGQCMASTLKPPLPVPPRAAADDDALSKQLGATPSTATPSSAPALSPRSTSDETPTPSPTGLARRCRVPPGTHINIYGQPSSKSWVISSLKPLALVFTSGATELREEGRWVQVVLPVGVGGWVLCETASGVKGLVMDEAAGRHGDHMESPGRLQASLRAHATAMLRLQLAPAPSVPASASGGRSPGSAVREVTNLKMGDHTGYLWAPEAPSARRMPLLVVLHGAGKGGWDFAQMARGYEAVANRWNVLVLIPAALSHTWDFIREGQREDTDFLQSAISYARQLYPVDDGRIAVMGMSDGASMGLSLALVNPTVFQAALVQAAGFYHDPAGTVPGDAEPAAKPTVWLEYGTRDEIFSFEGTAKVIRDQLAKTGHAVKFVAVEGGGHKVRQQFVDEAVGFWLGLPPLRR